MSIATISNWENDKNDVSTKYQPVLADALGVAPSELLAGEDLDISENAKDQLNKEISKLNKWRIEFEEDSARVEDRSVVSIDIGFHAFGLAVIAIFIAMIALFRESGVAILCGLIGVAFGIWFIFKGRKVVSGMEESKKKRTKG